MYNNRDKFKERVVMASGIYAEIKKRILDAEYGAVFVTSDFTDIATITTIRKCLGRQVERKQFEELSMEFTKNLYIAIYLRNMFLLIRKK